MVAGEEVILVWFVVASEQNSAQNHSSGCLNRFFRWLRNQSLDFVKSRSVVAASSLQLAKSAVTS